MIEDVDAWLLDTDPTLRWQVEKDVLHRPETHWGSTRSQIPEVGFGARLLAEQDADGRWAGGAYFPGGFFDDPANQDLPGQPWTATTWTLTTLREWGMDPSPLTDRGTAALLEEGCRWEYEDLPYWDGEVDACINGMTLANGAWLGADVTPIAAWFPEHQLADGGWNCEWVEGSVRSSFHSTLNSIKGLLSHEELTGGSDALRDARHRAEEYLLERELHRRLSTGDPVGAWVDRFRYPYRWAYSVLHAAEHFRRASALDGTPPDPRMGPAIEMIRAARRPDGTWVQGPTLPGATWFEVDVPEGQPSPWLTLSGLRVLEWWDAAAPPAAP